MYLKGPGLELILSGLYPNLHKRRAGYDLYRRGVELGFWGGNQFVAFIYLLRAAG